MVIQSIVVEIVMDNVVVIVFVVVLVVMIFVNIIVNGGFEDYLRIGNIFLWIDIRDFIGGRFDVVNGVNLCMLGGFYCVGG